jgi:hypothetical protein
MHTRVSKKPFTHTESVLSSYTQLSIEKEKKKKKTKEQKTAKPQSHA